MAKKEETKREKLNQGRAHVPHIDRTETIVSSFLERGEKHDLQHDAADESPKKKQQQQNWMVTRTWKDLWDDRQAIYRAKEKPVETYEPTSMEKLVAIVTYMAFFVPLLTKHNKTSGFVNFHLKQSVNLAISSIFVLTGYGLAIFIATIYIPPTADESLPFYVALSLIWILPIYMIFTGIKNASQGEWKKLPLIGKEILTD